MNFYVIPVIVALFVKILALVIAKRSGIRTQYLYAFIGTFAVHNLCELFLFINGNHADPTTDLILRFYYAITFILVAYACSCALEVSNVDKKQFTKFIEKYVWLGAIAGALLSLISDQIITGAKPLSYTVTAIKGSNYWFFQVISAVALSNGAYALTREAQTATLKMQKSRCIKMLVAYIPILVGSLGVLVLMRNGFQVNATMVLPVTSIFFLGFLVYSERQHRLTDIRRLIPGTHENRIMDELHQAFAKYAAKEVGYQDAKATIDALLVSYAYDKHEGNVTHAADFMQVPRSTLYTIMGRLKISKKPDS